MHYHPHSLVRCDITAQITQYYLALATANLLTAFLPHITKQLHPKEMMKSYVVEPFKVLLS